MLYMLGTLTLDTRPFSIDSFDRDATASIVSKPVIGGFQPKEFTGEGDDKITLAGQLLPSKIGGLTELELAHSMRKSGTRVPVMRGDGVRLGWYAITQVTEKHEDLTRDGVGFVVKHTIKMTKTEPDLGSGSQIISGLLTLFDLLGG